MSQFTFPLPQETSVRHPLGNLSCSGVGSLLGVWEGMCVVMTYHSVSGGSRGGFA